MATGHDFEIRGNALEKSSKVWIWPGNGDESLIEHDFSPIKHIKLGCVCGSVHVWNLLFTEIIFSYIFSHLAGIAQTHLFQRIPWICGRCFSWDLLSCWWYNNSGGNRVAWFCVFAGYIDAPEMGNLPAALYLLFAEDYYYCSKSIFLLGVIHHLDPIGESTSWKILLHQALVSVPWVSYDRSR